MKSTNHTHRFLSAVALIAMLCVVSSVRADEPVAREDPDNTSGVQDLPPFEAMLATALTHNPDVRAAQAQLDRARLHVVQEIRAFREEWRAAKAAIADVNIAQREFDRLGQLGEGVVAGRKLLEARHALEVAKQRAATAEAKLKELRLLLPHLSGHAVVARTNDDHHHGHDHNAHHHGHDAVGGPVEKLLRERIEVLAKIVELQQAAYRSSEVSFDEVAKAQLDFMAAKLELAKSADERLKIRQQMVHVARQIEEVTKRLVREQETSQANALKASALRLRAEADLKREQSAAEHHH